ncbi:MAG: hydantoinase/carbamoylase family amidase [Alphaproteobacteria bacterium]|nr:hydantoinase/carbamoylase family amidase [Alphaproteobacteria bacterium]
MRASERVNERRLWQRHVDMAKLGGLPRGGVNRQALSPEDAAARRLLAEWAAARGFDVYGDPIGNLYVRRAGTEADAPPVLTGSHMDSQPTGGKYDGMYGVLAGFEALEALEDAGIRTRRPVAVIAWMNEEGSRFQPGAMGSAVWGGDYALSAMLDVTDRAGVRLGDALKDTLSVAPCRIVPDFDRRFHAYIEAHIEQGPRLEADRRTIGVVTGIQGSQRYTVDISGEEAHAGTTPLRVRKDALRSAIAVVDALQRHMNDPADVVRFTVGRFECRPGSPNTVPGHVHFTVDFRHPDATVLARLGDGIERVVAASVAPCTAKVVRITDVAPTVFDARIVDLVRAKSEALGLPNMDMPSGAGHDAMHVAPHGPAGMIFVPCERGISHNEAEAATPADLAAGARVLVDCLAELANE